MNKTEGVVALARAIIELMLSVVQTVKGSKKRTIFFVALLVGLSMFLAGTYFIYLSS